MSSRSNLLLNSVPWSDVITFGNPILMKIYEKIKHQYNIDIHMQSTLKSTIATVDADLSTVGTASTHFEK